MKLGEFKSEFLSLNGAARPNLFWVTLYRSPKSIDGENFGLDGSRTSYWCKSVTMPGINFKTFDYAATNMGLTQAIPFSINSEPLQCTFILDSKHGILNFFRTWAELIMNNTHPNSGSNTNSRGKKRNELEYVANYSTTMQIDFFSSDNNGDAYTVKLFDVFPTNIASINLSWDDNDSYATLPVAFSYSGFETSRLANNSGADALERMKENIRGVYYEGGKNLHTNDINRGGMNIQDFIDLETNWNYQAKTKGKELLKKLF